MRERARQSLEKLHNLRPARNYVVINNDIGNDWYRCSIGNNSRARMIEWANKNCIGRFSRDWDSYYFENQRDAFAYKLRWGKNEQGKT